MLIDNIKVRHSIRRYTRQNISRAVLETILEAGNYAFNAGGGQRSMMVAVHDPELTRKIGIMNMAHFNRKGLAGSYVSKEQPSVIEQLISGCS